MPDPVAQRQKRHQRRRHRQDDPDQELEVAAPVDASGLLHLVRDGGLEEGARDDDHEGVHGVGSDHRPERVQHAEVAHHQVGRDQSAGQVQGDDQDLQDGLAAAQVLARQRVRRQHGQEHVQRDAADHVDQAVAEAAPDHRGGQDAVVCVEGQALRPQHHRFPQELLDVAERGDEHVPQRIDDDEQEQADQGDVHDVEDPLRPRAGKGVQAVICRHPHRLTPRTRLEMVFAATRNRMLMTMLKIEIAVE